jgi:hypothetical protein
MPNRREIARGASCVVAIANRSKTLAGILTGLDGFRGGIAISDHLTENSVGSRNEQSRTLNVPLCDCAPGVGRLASNQAKPFFAGGPL